MPIRKFAIDLGVRRLLVMSPLLLASAAFSAEPVANDSRALDKDPECSTAASSFADRVLPRGIYRRYCRPELFDPPTVSLRARLSTNAAGRNAGKGPERIEQISAQAASVNPAAASLSDASDAAPPSDGTDGKQSTEVPLEVIAPSDLRDPASKYIVEVGDTCAGGSAPQIVVNPSTAVSKPLAKRDGRWYTIELSSQQMLGQESVALRVRSCRAAQLTDEAARAQALLVTVSIPAAGRSISTTLNVWSRGDVAEMFGEEFSRTFIVADAVVVNPLEHSVLVYGASLSARVRLLPARADVRRVFGDAIFKDPELMWSSAYDGRGRSGQLLSFDACEKENAQAASIGDESLSDCRPLADALNFTESYRPLSFSDVLAIFSYKRASDPRERTVSSLKSVGQLLTAGALFKVGRDYAKGVAFFTGAFIPELEKQILWDVLLHIKNLEQRSFKEVEEIPARGQLRKVVFFPRRPIEGVLPSLPMYIAEIRADEIPLTAVVLEKTQSIPGTSPAAK